jgi:hypothetical protein
MDSANLVGRDVNAEANRVQLVHVDSDPHRGAGYIRRRLEQLIFR